MSIVTQNNDRMEWLKDRRKGIGGSDVAAIIGINPWQTPLDVYLDKTGQTPLETPDNPAMYWGRQLEDLVAQEFALRTEKTVQRRNNSYVHPDHEFLRANLDRYIVGERAVLECKTASEWSKDEWGPNGSNTDTDADCVPMMYLCQVMHYMTVTGYHHAYLAVLIGGRDYRMYEIPYNEAIAGKLLAKCRSFWKRVIDKCPPAPVNPKDVENFFPGKDALETCATATNEIHGQLARYRELKKGISDKYAEIDELRTEITGFMGNNSVLVDEEGKTLATWKASKDKQTRTFRPKY